VTGGDPDSPPGTPRDRLFELAVARADAYLQRARVPADRDPHTIARALEAWALRTRFASRLDLLKVAQVLAARPQGRVSYRDGAWRRESR
jgi:hypothetical protein